MKNLNQNLEHKELLEKVKYNSLTGIFTNKKTGDILGHNDDNDDYIRIKIKGQNYLAHRLAWFYVYGYFPEGNVDHRDRVGYHNWILNLREATQICNIRNTGNFSHNTSGIKGVYWDKHSEKWQSRICVNQKAKGLGYYKDFDEAVCARLAGEQCVDWSNCDSNSPAFKYVKENIQNVQLCLGNF